MASSEWSKEFPTEEGTYVFRGIWTPMEGRDGITWELPAALVLVKRDDPFTGLTGLVTAFTQYGTKGGYAFPEELGGEWLRVAGREEGIELWYQTSSGKIIAPD